MESDSEDEEEDAASNDGKSNRSSSKSSSESGIPGPLTQRRNSFINKVKSKLIRKTADHGQTFDIPTKLALVNCLKDINKRKTITYKQAIKTIDWTKVDITGHSQEELKECLNEILTSVCSIRTLDEMLDDYIENYRRYELKKNPNAPKIPTNPCMQYITEHRAELQKKLKKKYPGESITLVSIN